MPRVVITYGVEDVERWLRGKQERAGAIGMTNGKNVVNHVAQDGSNRIAVTSDVDDVETVMASTASPSAEVAAARQRHGVVPPLTVST
jgi:hypothetical protein